MPRAAILRPAITMVAVFILGFFSFFSSLAMAETFKEDVDYTRISKPARTENPDKIEVREFFWYGCPHCYKMESFLKPWLAKKPNDVEFIRTPGVLNRNWEVHARAFYVAQSQGMVEKTHSALFDAIHNEKRKLDSQKDLAEFYKGYGVDTNTFDKKFKSFDVTTEIRQADALARVYRLMGVPAVVINGKYVTTAKQAQSYERWMQIVDYLIDLERQAKSK
ncbi:MAG TPA: thiol:disulfide interchange protein DsbA/DsbL [Pseudomonadales bacterium]